ncbi:8-oxo-dGTP pyrophosphatase MutT (NUDIX family) [Kitasatospora sp. MAA19]|uniref:NUDIX hydrolase n=1 Tax=Kitasatospora sp. MAA19 TaxID=3035090 RepID=UPI002473FB72|nr:NUDIX domain-containing protein [Kitasatospora sp. MAA19]MDH6706092.1 8-oxo-dGTP pyrophosphatase MutT (NUDIX family) [Kitasatospora sp. MAA19]
MTTSTHLPNPLQVLKVSALRLVEAAVPQLAQEHQVAMDRVWRAATQANLDLFDGPAVACTGVKNDDQAIVLSWAPVTYRWFALRRVPEAPAVSSVFVTVAQPTDDGALIVGRMSGSTAAPGRWQFPGGNVEPPTVGRTLDENELRRQACKELAEEIGVHVAPEVLCHMHCSGAGCHKRSHAASSTVVRSVLEQKIGDPGGARTPRGQATGAETPDARPS